MMPPRARTHPQKRTVAARRMGERETRKIVGAAVVAGCNGPPVLLSGKEILDFVTLAIQPLAVMHWFLAAATGRDALLDQHLTDFVPVIPLIPHHRCRGLHNTSAPVKSLHCPSRRWSRRGPPLLRQTPWSLLAIPPLAPPIRRGGTPPLLRLDAVGWALTSVVSIITRTSGSGASGGSGASDADNSERSDDQPPLVSPAAATVVEGFVGAIGSRGIHPAQTLLNDRDDAASHPVPWGTRGRCGGNLCAEPKQPGHHPSPPGALLGLPASLVW